MEYFKFEFNLNNDQLKEVTDAIKSKKPVMIKLTSDSYKGGTVALPVTKCDMNKVLNVKNLNYRLDKEKLEQLKLQERDGGFFPALIPILAGIGALGGLAGGAAGIAKTVLDKKAKDVEQVEEARHNKEIESIARGEGVVSSEGIYLNPYRLGDGIKEIIDNSKLDPIGKKTL